MRSLWLITALFVETAVYGMTPEFWRDRSDLVVSSLLANLCQALRDLADPQEGVYNATALLAERLSYLDVNAEQVREAAQPGAHRSARCWDPLCPAAPWRRLPRPLAMICSACLEVRCTYRHLSSSTYCLLWHRHSQA